MSGQAVADEGMWQPYQLPELRERLLKQGLELDPDQLTSFESFPLTAIVSLGGCTASFVSPLGLVVTNHHCVFGSVQFNSTTDNNLLQDGYLARSVKDELPAAQGTRVYVTEAVTDVTDKVLGNVNDNMSGYERYKAIEDNRKALIKECEQTKIHRCGVPAFHHGLEYYLIKRLEIRDVRLVYAPATAIGKYGGDIDNWQWPRHTGDFGFYRAYVARDGKPADYSEDNVPYKPAGFLKVSADGVREGDFVMAAGYPGRTNRYRRAAEIDHRFNWYYPTARGYREELIATIDQASPADSQARLNYASTLASLANYAKNFQSMEESFKHSDFLQRRRMSELGFAAWLTTYGSVRTDALAAVQELDDLILKSQDKAARDLWLGYFDYATLPRVARRLYRLAVEKQKPDEEREPGFQERDEILFRQSLQRMTRNYDARVDMAILAYLLQRYRELDETQQIESIGKYFESDTKRLDRQLQRFYRQSDLGDETVRLDWMEKDVAEFRKSRDPFIRFAVQSFDELMALEMENKELSGQFQRARPRYMQALIEYNRSLGQAIYADANSSLRITFGQVKGNRPRDGLLNLPFTTLEGILEKDTGEDPFNAPAAQLELIREKTYGRYELPELGSVPVNFLNTLDITGGNSGSPALNGRGELVGLLFDGVYESIIGDWDFNDALNRAIAVDVRYMLWVMENLDGAGNLLDEMTIVGSE